MAELQSTAQLAERWKVSVRHLERLRTEGGGPPFIRLGARRVGYRLDDIHAWEAARRFRSTSHEDAVAAGTAPQPSAQP